MKQFATYEEENIHYWTNRASGYSTVNQEELASDQKTVWRGVISGRIAARFPDRCPEEIRVLDVGTGPGFFAIILAELGYQVTAVDYTASMLEEARHNAGALAKHIHFQQMNAEKLAFQTASFDVLVTRNVTWNLHDPEKAYAQWMRVLKPGGLLLNFDANWYRYLWDEDAQLAHAQDRENLHSSDVRDETAGTDVSAMEAIARRHRFPRTSVLHGIYGCYADSGCRLPRIRRSGSRSGQRKSASTTPQHQCFWWKAGSVLCFSKEIF